MHGNRERERGRERGERERGERERGGERGGGEREREVASSCTCDIKCTYMNRLYFVFPPVEKKASRKADPEVVMEKLLKKKESMYINQEEVS